MTAATQISSPHSSGRLTSDWTIEQKKVNRPRLGFLGVGWIGRNRMEAMAKTGCAEIVAIGDPVSENLEAARKISPAAGLVGSLDELLSMQIDGVVIATPSALHAEQSIAALEKGMAVFCQKPLARTADETSAVIEAARKADRLLGVDLSYRFAAGIQKLQSIIERGELGEIFAADLVFHNAYGPDKKWFYDPKLSGGGCVIDLGIHLVDLALWLLKEPNVSNVSSRLFAKGKPLIDPKAQIEDFATARLDLETGPVIQLACSWNLPAGCDAIINATFYGTRGGVSFRNVNGSFYDFIAEKFVGTKRELLASSPDDWGARAAVEWTRQLAAGAKYNSEIETLIDVAAVLDRIYGR